MEQLAQAAIILLKLLPAMIGAIFAIIWNPPKTKIGMFFVWVFSIGCGVWFGPAVFSWAPWLGQSGSGFAAACLGLIVLRSVSGHVEKFDWGNLWPFAKKE